MGSLQKKAEIKMKVMDIRTAFQSSVTTRKRKAPESEASKKAKSIKTVHCDLEEKDTDEIQILEIGKDSVEQCNNEESSKNASENCISDTKETSADTKQDSIQNSVNESSHEDNSNDNSNSEAMELSTNANTSLNTSVSSDAAGVTVSKPSTTADDSSSNENCNEVNKSLQNSASASNGEKSSNSAKKRKKMTPAEAKKREELRAQKMKERELKAAAKNEEKMRREEEKQQRKQQLENEKKEKIRLKQERKEQEELRRQKEKEDRRKEKEEQNRLKNELKAEEKRKKEEQRIKALDEKKKAEEEKLRAEEEKKRIQLEKEKKTKEVFQNFFVKSGFSISSNQVVEAPVVPPKEDVFLPFQVTKDMVLASIVPPAAQERFDRKVLEKCLQNQDHNELYLDLLKSGKHKGITIKKERKKRETESSDVIVIVREPEVCLNIKAKLLQFCENIRPAYWGTWRKKSANISGRRPFGKDQIFDYEVDSDEEWDEGGPGESLTGTEDEESEDDYEVDNEFFVPHGYLSAEEEGDDDEDAEPTDPEVLKTRLKMKETEFLSERKKKTVELKPVILGCYFHADQVFAEIEFEAFLEPYTAEILIEKDISFTPIISSSQGSDPKVLDVEGSEKTSPKADVKGQCTSVLKRPCPEEAIPHLIRLLHGNTNTRGFMVKEFQAFWQDHCKKLDSGAQDTEHKENHTPMCTETELVDSKESEEQKTNKGLSKNIISRTQLLATMKNISTWGKCPDSVLKRCCWWVKDDIRKKYGVDVPIPNEWKYILQNEGTVPSSQSA